MSSNPIIRDGIRRALIARTEYAIEYGAVNVFVETRELALLLDVPFPEPEPQSDMDTAELDFRGMELARYQRLCEMETRPMQPVGD